MSPSIPTPSTWEEELAYFFWPGVRHSDPGHPRLKVKLLAAPAGQHFEPEYLDLQIKSLDGPSPSIQALKVYHPWTSAPIIPVAAGCLTIVDWNKREVEGFTFGGALQIENQERFTLCTLESPAPIIDLKDGSEIARMLVEETEGLLARRRAVWIGKEDEFDRRLALIEPFELYICCLNALRNYFDSSHYKSLPHVLRFLHFIHTEISALQEAGRWITAIPTLEEVL